MLDQRQMQHAGKTMGMAVPNPRRPVHTLRMAMPRTRSAGDDGQAIGLPAALGAALDDFSRHLDAERALSRHTVRAYHGDIQSLLVYAYQPGIDDPVGLDVTTLRGWLASQHQAGAARATLAR